MNDYDRESAVFRAVKNRNRHVSWTGSDSKSVALLSTEVGNPDCGQIFGFQDSAQGCVRIANADRVLFLAGDAVPGDENLPGKSIRIRVRSSVTGENADLQNV